MISTEVPERKINGTREVGENSSTGAEQVSRAAVGDNSATAARPDEELLCTLCGLRACWTR